MNEGITFFPPVYNPVSSCVWMKESHVFPGSIWSRKSEVYAFAWRTAQQKIAQTSPPSPPRHSTPWGRYSGTLAALNHYYYYVRRNPAVLNFFIELESVGGVGVFLFKKLLGGSDPFQPTKRPRLSSSLFSIPTIRRNFWGIALHRWSFRAFFHCHCRRSIAGRGRGTIWIKKVEKLCTPVAIVCLCVTIHPVSCRCWLPAGTFFDTGNIFV